MGTRAARLALVATVVVGVLAALTAPASGASWAHEVLDGTGDPGTGRVAHTVGWYNATATLGGQPHVWHHDATDGDLRHTWYSPGPGWRSETLDGDTAAAGRTTGTVGRFAAVAVAGGAPHVFYYDDTAGALRHTWYTGREWQHETLDGDATTNGRTTHTVGSYNTAVLAGGAPHVFYYDDTDRDLRHAWYTPAGWAYETLDGHTTTNGRTTDDVGTDASVVVMAELPHVFYYDGTDGDLRHAWYTPAGWAYETLDGHTTTNGRTTDDVGRYNVVVVVEGLPHVFYHDGTDGDLRHAWYTPAGWAYETLDGHTTTNGRTTDDVGTWNAGVLTGGALHLFYADATDADLRHAWYTPTGWAYETLDGDADDAGRTDADVGTDTAVLVSGGRPHVWYHDTSSGLLRHAWFT